jgi:phosphopantothenoylcysteine decarboxylase/phosphopantothenate--cysteine ligase
MQLTNPGFQGIRILIGITGSIAAYKIAEWVRNLIKEEALITVVMTDAASRFITPLTFAALTGNRVYTDMFEEDAEGVMAHINLSKEQDLMLVAPATAQTLYKLARGAAGDLLSTTVLASNKPVVICPAMNPNMYAHPATKQNIKQLKQYGYHVVSAGFGEMACGDSGNGRLPDWDPVRESLLTVLSPSDLINKNIVITAGPTREPLDPARYISNRSSGKMGYALARAARRRGGQVTLISGPVSLPAPPGVTVEYVQTALEMERAVCNHADTADVVIKAAAVADYRPKVAKSHKIKKKSESLALELIKNNDILSKLGRNRKKGSVLVGFAAESENHQQEGYRKLIEKNTDLIIVNDILGKQTGFDVDTNEVMIVSRNGMTRTPLLSKEGTANLIIDKIVSLLA